MNPKTTIILLAILAGGIAVYLFVEGVSEPPPVAGLLFPDLNPKDVVSLEWNMDGVSREVRRSPDGFEVRAGESWVPADGAKLAEVLSDLGGLMRKKLLAATDVSAKSRQEYALDPPIAWLEFTVADETRRISFGRDSMQRDTLYATLDGSDDVLVIGDDLFKSARPLTTDELRQRQIVSLLVDDVDRIEVKQAGVSRVVFARGEGGMWRVTAPFNDFAEPTRVEGRLFQAVAKLSADEFVVDGLEDLDLAKYGLDAPRYSVSVHRYRGGDETVTILVGSDVPDVRDQVYLQREGRPNVYAVTAGTLLAMLPDDPSKYRDPSVTRLGWTPAETIEVTWGERKFTAVKEHGEWHLTAPATRLLETAEVTSMLTALRELTAVSFVDSPDLAALGLAEPAGLIVLRAAEETDHTHGLDEEAAPPAGKPADPILVLRIGNRSPEGGIHVLREGNGSVAYVVGSELAGWLDRGYHGLLPRVVFPKAPESATVAELSRQVGSEDVKVSRAGDAWDPPGTRAIAVSEVVAKLFGLVAVRWEGPAEGAPAEYGLTDGAYFELLATFVAKEGDLEIRKEYGLVVGAETEGGRFARPIRNGEPGEDILVISPADLSSLSIPLGE